MAKPSPTARAEAAAWLARLHGPNRTPEVEAGFRRWLSEDPERAEAFELITDTWEKSARLRRRPLERMVSSRPPGFRLSFARAAFATIAVAALAVLGTAFYFQIGAVSTRIGEQRTLTLEDGTRVHLNTDSRIAQHYSKDARRIELDRGEAFFEVAKNPNWPFIVTAGHRQVRALGTSFVVRRDEDDIAVTLVEGKVTVTPIESDVTDARRRREQRSPTLLHGVEKKGPTKREDEVLLAPGQRITFASTEPPRLDTPALERITAWQRGQVVLDNVPLADAVAEMNRYSNTRLIIEDPRIAAIPVSGIFRAGDQNDFAQAVAKTYKLQRVQEGDQIILQ